jgi:hypothetical protein
VNEAACGDSAAGGADSGSGDALEEARELAARLVAAADGAVTAVILYGSRLLGANPDRHSALDFVVLVDGYSRFYRAMQAAGELHRPVWLLAGLSRVMPPNVIAFTPGEGADGIAKCLVISATDFDVGLGPRPPDHFLVARLVQKVAVIWARDREVARRVEERLAATHAEVLSWVGPWLDDGFDAEAVGRKLLEVCYRGEFRPEAHNRAWSRGGGRRRRPEGGRGMRDLPVRNAPLPRGAAPLARLLQAVQGPRHRAVAQARVHVRQLASLHRPQGGAPYGAEGDADSPGAQVAPHLPVAADHPRAPQSARA